MEQMRLSNLTILLSLSVRTERGAWREEGVVGQKKKARNVWSLSLRRVVVSASVLGMLGRVVPWAHAGSVLPLIGPVRVSN